MSNVFVFPERSRRKMQAIAAAKQLQNRVDSAAKFERKPQRPAAGVQRGRRCCMSTAQSGCVSKEHCSDADRRLNEACGLGM